MHLLLLLAASQASTGVRINEILYNPTGTDTGAEWIELCNSGTTTVDLTGYTIQVAGSSWSTIYTFPALSIAPGEYLLIGAGSAYALGGTMQNGGSATDGVRLYGGGGVVDTLLYDEPNTNNLVDDSGAVGVEFAPTVSEGSSLGRYPDCADSEDSSVDFRAFSSPSPGAENTVGGGGGGTCADPEIRLNELVPDPDGSDSGNEWLELYNPTDRMVDLSGWQIKMRKSASTSKTVTIPEETWIGPGSYLVVGEESVSFADVVLDLDLGNDSSSIDAVELYCAGALVDLGAYGGKNDLGWTHEDGALASVFPKPGSGQSMGRVPDGQDTNDCAVDWALLETPTPGAANRLDVDCTCPGTDAVRINEFIPNPAKPSGATDEDPEWIELFNTGSGSVSLVGWSLRYGTSPSSTKTVDLSALGSIGPGEYLVVGEEGAANVDLVVSIDMGAASSNADRLELRDCSTCTADTVVYGSVNSDGWTDDSGAVATSLAPKPSDGDTLQRCRDGYDTDESATDWVIAETPTPGEPNADSACPICAPGSGTIKINELFPDPEGSDGKQEWIEVYNAGSTSQRLDGWVIETGTSSWGVDFTFPGEIELAPGEFLLIGNVDVPTADLYASSLGLGNASKNPDGARLLDCEGAVQDTVLYGDGDGTLQDKGLTDDQGAYTQATMGDSGRSISRKVDGQDTDDNAADFSGNAGPTPGGPNAGGGSGDGGSDEEDGGKGGCGKGKGGREGGKKCGVVGIAGGLEWALLAFVALRRRRG